MGRGMPGFSELRIRSLTSLVLRSTVAKEYSPSIAEEEPPSAILNQYEKFIFPWRIPFPAKLPRDFRCDSRSHCRSRLDQSLGGRAGHAGTRGSQEVSYWLGTLLGAWRVGARPAQHSEDGCEIRLRGGRVLFAVLQVDAGLHQRRPRANGGSWPSLLFDAQRFRVVHSGRKH